MSRCLIIATDAEGGWYHQPKIWSPLYDIALINFNPQHFNREGDKELLKYYYTPESQGFKHQLYKQFIEQYEILDKYDWIWMPDYDVQLERADIERLFAIAEDYNLNICQPSLTPSSFRSFDIVINDPTKLLRYTNYVEVMCPLFNTQALRKLLWTFVLTYSGWAQDFIWARDLQYERLAIIDDVQAAHVKPVESQYWKLPNGLNADQELDFVIKLFALKHEDFWPKVLGGIDKWT